MGLLAHQSLWGRQFCLQPPFRRLVCKVSRLKAGCSQDWLPSTEHYETSQVSLINSNYKIENRITEQPKN